jgi:DNA-binding response OmpR family regulator
MKNGKGAAPATGADGAPSNVPRALRVLVAEDDRDTALMLMMILRDEGYETRAVHTGRNVMAAILDFQPHAVLLDLNLPDLSGWQVASTIRSRRAKPPLLIAITGYFTKGADRILSQLTGFDHYLLKPCEPKELLKLLEPLRSPDSDSSLF